MGEMMIPLMNAAGWVKKPADVEPLLKIDSAILPAITLGSYTLEPRDGNPGQNFWSDGESSPSSLNALGLPNPGIGFPELPELVKRIQSAGKAVRISVAGFKVEEYRNLSLRVADMGADEVELNLGCPNVRYEGRQKPIFAFNPELVYEIIYRSCINLAGGPTVVVKLSPYSDPALLMQIAQVVGGPGIKRVIRAIMASNTFPNAYGFDDEGKSVIVANSGYGGLGGFAMKHIALGQVRQFSDQLSDGPVKVIGVGGVSCAQDVRDFVNAGASEVQIGTSFFLRGPKIFPEIAMDLAEE